ncbi:MAG: hypothetical protein RL722_1588 [Pseudomonadota bacterium]|jgi:murein DD-endopeptidase MepM/ murein hydrolase activator NlpD
MPSLAHLSRADLRPALNPWLRAVLAQSPAWARRRLFKALRLARRHPRPLTLAAGTLVLSTAMAAFAPAPEHLPGEVTITPRLLTETVPVQDLRPQFEALENRELLLSAQTLTRSGDSLDSLLGRLGVQDPEALAALRREPQLKQVLQGRSGKSVQARYLSGSAGLTRLQSLQVLGPALAADQAETHYSRLSLRHEGGRWATQTEQLPVQVQVAMASGYIRTSLFAAADEARIPDALVLQMADIFGSEIDFRRDLRKGDQFVIVYEAASAEGQPVSWGSSSVRVLAARFINQGKAHEALWFQDGHERGAWYGADGRNKARTFLASPLAFSRVTSGFSMRMHPIHNTWRAHLGVDYGAPQGTPVRSVSDGTVEFAGRQNGYGNVVMLRHGGSRTTLYAHLSRLGVKVGQKVAQGQVIGQVGATGWATGPHLHFEFKVDGKQMDPVKMARNSDAQSLPAGSRPAFEAQWSVTREQLTAAELPPVDTAQFARME